MHLVFMIADVNSNDPKYRLSGKCHLCMWDKCWKDTGDAYNHRNYSGLETNTFLPAHGHFGLLIPLSQPCKKEITVLEEMIDSEWPVVVVNRLLPYSYSEYQFVWSTLLVVTLSCD